MSRYRVIPITFHSAKNMNALFCWLVYPALQVLLSWVESMRAAATLEPLV
jgi:hypothetical protein